MGWAIGYTRSQDVLDSKLRSDLLRDLGAVAAIMLVTVLALTVVSRQITRPLAMLARAAAALGSAAGAWTSGAAHRTLTSRLSNRRSRS